jgi:hypothetical protein
MKNKSTKITDYRREWMVIPGTGSIQRNIDSAYWDAISKQVCPHCHLKIGEGCGIYLFLPHQKAEHVVCAEKAEEEWDKLRNNAYMIDAAARIGGITQEQFRNLAVWEKDRLLEEARKVSV